MHEAQQVQAGGEILTQARSMHCLDIQQDRKLLSGMHSFNLTRKGRHTIQADNIL